MIPLASSVWKGNLVEWQEHRLGFGQTSFESYIPEVAQILVEGIL